MDTPAHPLGNPSVRIGITILGVYSHPPCRAVRFIINTLGKIGEASVLGSGCIGFRKPYPSGHDPR